MAYYEYRCPDCGTDFEIKKSMKDFDRIEYCPSCTCISNRLLNPIGHIWGKESWDFDNDGLGDELEHNF